VSLSHVLKLHANYCNFSSCNCCLAILKGRVACASVKNIFLDLVLVLAGRNLWGLCNWACSDKAEGGLHVPLQHFNNKPTWGWAIHWASRRSLGISLLFFIAFNEFLPVGKLKTFNIWVGGVIFIPLAFITNASYAKCLHQYCCLIRIMRMGRACYCCLSNILSYQ